MTDNREPLVDPQVVAEYLGLSLNRLAQLRMEPNEGPQFVRVGRTIRYRMSEVDAWIEANTHTSTHVA